MIRYEYKGAGHRTWKPMSLSTRVEIDDAEKDAYRKTIAARLTRESGSPHDWRDIAIRAIQEAQ